MEKNYNYIYCAYEYVFLNPKNRTQKLVIDSNNTDHSDSIRQIVTNEYYPFLRIIYSYWIENELQKVQ